MRYQLTVSLVITMVTQVQLNTTDSDGVETNSVVQNSINYVRKCCPHGKGLIGTECRNMSEPFNLTRWKGSNRFRASNKVVIVVGIGCSHGSVPMIAYPNHQDGSYYLTSDGKLFVPTDPNHIKKIFDKDEYCLENFLNDVGHYVINAAFCLKPNDEDFTLNACCMLISCFFILLTVGIYARQPEIRKLPNKVLIAYLLSFFVSFLCLAIIICLDRKKPSQALCSTFTFIIYFSILAAFCWINVMSYDIWTTFGGKPRSRTSSSGSRFYWYCLYGFGVPTAMSAMLAIFEYTDIQVPIKPDLFAQKCFFDGIVKQVYLYIPILILCIANTIFFILTAVKIAYDRKEAAKINSQDSRIHNRKDEKLRFYLYIKLFTMMGVSWVLEVISSFFPEPAWLWKVTGVYNLLVGFFIFLMFGWEKIKEIKRFNFMPKSTAQTAVTVSQQTPSTQSTDISNHNGHIEMPLLNSDRNI